MMTFIFCLAQNGSLQRFKQTSFLQVYMRKPTTVNREPDTDLRGASVDQSQELICCEWVRVVGK